jgi:hypothetical protein
VGWSHAAALIEVRSEDPINRRDYLCYWPY